MKTPHFLLMAVTVLTLPFASAKAAMIVGSVSRSATAYTYLAEGNSLSNPPEENSYTSDIGPVSLQANGLSGIGESHIYVSASASGDVQMDSTSLFIQHQTSYVYDELIAPSEAGVFSAASFGTSLDVIFSIDTEMQYDLEYEVTSYNFAIGLTIWGPNGFLLSGYSFSQSGILEPGVYTIKNAINVSGGSGFNYYGVEQNTQTGGSNLSFSVHPVPEPSTWGLLLLGCVLFGGLQMQRSKYAAKKAALLIPILLIATVCIAQQADAAILVDSVSHSTSAIANVDSNSNPGYGYSQSPSYTDAYTKSTGGMSATAIASVSINSQLSVNADVLSLSETQETSDTILAFGGQGGYRQAMSNITTSIDFTVSDSYNFTLNISNAGFTFVQLSNLSSLTTVYSSYYSDNVSGTLAAGSYRLSIATITSTSSSQIAGSVSVGLNVQPVPEPSTWRMLLIGGILFGGFRFMRRSKAVVIRGNAAIPSSFAKLGSCICLAGFVVSSPNTKATFIYNDYGLDAPQQTLTLSEVVLPDKTLLTSQYENFGITFGNTYYRTNANVSAPHLDAPAMANFLPGVDTDTPNISYIFFNTPQTEAAFALVSQNGIATFTAYLNGEVVETGSEASGFGATNFYGFKDIVFDAIAFQVDSYDRAAFIDNVQTVPEPSTCVLLAAGVGLFVTIHRKKSSPKAAVSFLS